jgi:hypothetical protein
VIYLVLALIIPACVFAAVNSVVNYREGKGSLLGLKIVGSIFLWMHIVVLMEIGRLISVKP